MNRLERRKYSKSIPRHTSKTTNKIILALNAIDNQIKEFINDILKDLNINSDNIYYKTELDKLCYNVLLYNSETKQTVGHSWLLTIFLELCSKKRIEFEMNTVIRKMILKLKEINVKETIWV